MVHKILVAVFSFLTIPTGAFADDTISQEALNNAHARFGTHGMVLYGQGVDASYFMSHIPMFHNHHHNMQIVMKVTVRNAQGELWTRELSDGEYSIYPQAFDLTELVRGNNFVGDTKTFSGTIFRGNFERADREQLLAGARITVEEVLHLRSLPHC